MASTERLPMSTLALVIHRQTLTGPRSRALWHNYSHWTKTKHKLAQLSRFVQAGDYITLSLTLLRQAHSCFRMASSENVLLSFLSTKSRHSGLQQKRLAL